MGILTFCSISLLFLIIWHCALVHTIANHLAQKKIGPSMYSLPEYDYFNNIQYTLPSNIQKVDVFNNIIYFCGSCMQSYVCIKQVVPPKLAWIDPYHLIAPLEIRVCL